MNHFKTVPVTSLKDAIGFLREECRTMNVCAEEDGEVPYPDVPAFKACIAAMRDEMKRRRKQASP